MDNHDRAEHQRLIDNAKAVSAEAQELIAIAKETILRARATRRRVSETPRYRRAPTAPSSE
jgi:hypothetical protein